MGTLGSANDCPECGSHATERHPQVEEVRVCHDCGHYFEEFDYNPLPDVTTREPDWL